MTATFVPYEEGMNFLLRSEVGPLAMFVNQRAELVKQFAERNVSGAGRPARRSGDLSGSIHYEGIRTTTEGPSAAIGTNVRSPRQNFNYPMALEIGMPAFAPLPNIAPNGWGAVSYATGRTQKPYHYPWLLPALREAFPDFVKV